MASTAAGQTAAGGPSVQGAATQDDVDGANTLGDIGIPQGSWVLSSLALALVRTRRTGSPPAEST